MADRRVQSTTTTTKKKKKLLSTLMLQNEQYSACLSKKGLSVKNESHLLRKVGAAKLDFGKINK